VNEEIEYARVYACEYVLLFLQACGCIQRGYKTRRKRRSKEVFVCVPFRGERNRMEDKDR